MSKPMTPEQEHEFFARPENQGPQGPPRRREASRLSAMGAGSVSTGFHPSCSPRAAAAPTPTTVRCRPGSAARWNTNSVTRPETTPTNRAMTASTASGY